MGCKVQSADKFEFCSDHIVVFSGSGHEYKITLDYCTCKGFKFHKDCRHMREAKLKGHWNLLEKRTPTLHITQCPSAIKLRKQAIKLFLTKNSIPFAESDIDKIESTMTISTTPQEILSSIN
jgi:hypothetical protein